jgi:hypothetical protein
VGRQTASTPVGGRSLSAAPMVLTATAVGPSLFPRELASLGCRWTRSQESRLLNCSGGPPSSRTAWADSVMSSVSTDRVRDGLTDPVLRLLRIDTGAIVAFEADVIGAIARDGDHALARSTH